jgi:integrase
MPLPGEVVTVTMPYLRRHVRGLEGFWLLTGCRPAEACQLRMRDEDSSGGVWVCSKLTVDDVAKVAARVAWQTVHGGRSKKLALTPSPQGHA